MAAAEYITLEKIGEGTFGQVFRAKRRVSGEVVALKRIRVKRAEDGLPLAALREIQALQHTNHANVVRLVDVFAHGANVVLALEYVPYDVARLLADTPVRLHAAQAKCLLLMLLHGVRALHDNQIIHRDLKPSNLLLTRAGMLKIADFGQSRIHAHGRDPGLAAEPYSHQVATRWYRAPELLFGARHYGTGVDMWAVGVIFAQVLGGGAPPFAGESDIDQLFRVVTALGTPSEAVWPGVGSLPDFAKLNFPDVAPRPLADVCPDATPGALDFLSFLLVYDPMRRADSRTASRHPYLFTEPLPVVPAELHSAV